MRTVALALAFPLVIAISSGVDALAGSEDLDAATAAVFLVPVLLFGLAVGEAWVLVLPALWAAVLLAVLRIADLMTGECTVCTSDESWSNYPFFFFVVAVVPVTLALAVGVALGLLARRFRRASPRSLGSA